MCSLDTLSLRLVRSCHLLRAAAGTLRSIRSLSSLPSAMIGSFVNRVLLCGSPLLVCFYFLILTFTATITLTTITAITIIIVSIQVSGYFCGCVCAQDTRDLPPRVRHVPPAPVDGLCRRLRCATRCTRSTLPPGEARSLSSFYLAPSLLLSYALAPPPDSSATMPGICPRSPAPLASDLGHRPAFERKRIGRLRTPARCCVLFIYLFIYSGSLFRACVRSASET